MWMEIGQLNKSAGDVPLLETRIPGVLHGSSTAQRRRADNGLGTMRGNRGDSSHDAPAHSVAGMGRAAEGADPERAQSV